LFVLDVKPLAPPILDGIRHLKGEVFDFGTIARTIMHASRGSKLVESSKIAITTTTTTTTTTIAGTTTITIAGTNTTTTTSQKSYLLICWLLSPTTIWLEDPLYLDPSSPPGSPLLSP
jgi:hypothetical protein